MKSKISIDVDFDNQPIIKIEFVNSEDVRDKLVQKFLETFAGDSSWAKFSHQGNGMIGLQPCKIANLRPIKVDELHGESGEMSKLDIELKELYKNLKTEKLHQIKEELEKT